MNGKMTLMYHLKEILSLLACNFNENISKMRGSPMSNFKRQEYSQY
jgi:hypothetical protein